VFLNYGAELYYSFVKRKADEDTKDEKERLRTVILDQAVPFLKRHDQVGSGTNLMMKLAGLTHGPDDESPQARPGSPGSRKEFPPAHLRRYSVTDWRTSFTPN